MKYSLFTVSAPEMSLEQVLEKLKENGYDGVDWRVTDIPTDPEILAEKPSYWRNNLCTVDINKVEEQAEEIRALTEKYGLEINALATYLDCSMDPAKSMHSGMTRKRDTPSCLLRQWQALER